MKIAVGFVLLFDQGVNEKVNKKFDIQHQLQNPTPCPNDVIPPYCIQNELHLSIFLKNMFVLTFNFKSTLFSKNWPTK